MAGRGRFHKGDPEAAVRFQHFGYACYISSPKMGIGHIHCILRRRQIPYHIDTEIKNHLPNSFYWPEKDRSTVISVIDALYSVDLKYLENCLMTFPNSNIGIEDFYFWATKHCLKITVNKKKVFFKQPIGKKIKRVPIYKLNWQGLNLAFSIDYYSSGDAWGELAIRKQITLLTLVQFDLKSSNYTILQHYPGKYRGLGLDPDSIHQILGKHPPRHRIGPLLEKTYNLPLPVSQSNRRQDGELNLLPETLH